MAWSFPFRVLRRAGSPRTGGDTHSLQGHIASPSAHPQYLKKGDSVGGVNLAEHEANPKAHQQHYLRRAELMTTLAQFLDLKNKNLYDGTSSVDSTYNVIATQAALHEMFSKENVQSVIPSIFVRERIVGTADGLRNILNEEINANTSADKKFVPSWDLFKQVWTFFASLKNGIDNDDTGDNPLADLFALKNHTHDTRYAAKQHSHRDWTDLMNDHGQIPAEENHDHDDRYIRKGEGGGDSDLSGLSEAGIYPRAYRFGEDAIELNERCRHGYTVYFMDGGNVISGLPPTIADAISGENAVTYVQTGDPSHISDTKDALTITALLNVIEGQHDHFTFTSANVYRYSDYISADPRASYSSCSVTQILSVNPSILAEKRAGATDAIKDAVINYKSSLRGVFWRTGFNLETAWYIESILSMLFGEDVSTFYGSASGTTNAADSEEDRNTRTSEIAAKFNAAVGNFINGETAPEGLYIGYFKYPFDTVVRSDNTGTKYAIKRSNTGINFVKDVLAHDSCSWILPGSLVQDGDVTLANNGTDNQLYKNLLVGTTADRFLSYQTYYTLQTVYNQTNSETPISGVDGYLLRTLDIGGAPIYSAIGGAGYNYGSKFVKQSETSADGFIDISCKILKQYTPVSGTAEAGCEYFTRSTSKDIYGIPVFESITLAAGAAMPENTYVKETVVTDGSTPDAANQPDVVIEYLWSKKPVRQYDPVSGTGEAFDASKPYYRYRNGGFEPATVSTTTGTDAETGETNTTLVAASVPLFVDYDIFTASTGLSEITDTSTYNYQNDDVYTRGLFFQTTDASPVTGKMYFTNIGAGVYSAVDTSTLNGDVSGLYECIDVETIFNIWCAIRTLTTTGADVTSAAYANASDSKRIVYHISDTGNLITWDPWEQIITASTPGQVEAMNAMSVTETPVEGGGSRAELTFEGNKVITDATLASYLSSNNVITSANLASALSGAGVITSSNLGTALDNLAPSGNTAGYIKFKITNGRLVFNDGTNDVTIANYSDINSGSGSGSSTVLTKLSIDSTHGWLMYTGSDNTLARVAMYSDIPEIVSKISETNDHKLTFTDGTNAAHTIAFTSDLHSHGNKTILDKFSESSNKLQYGATGAKKDVILSGDLPTAEKLSHEYEYTEVDTTAVSTPDANTTYYVDGSNDEKVLADNNGHPASFVAGSTYYTRTSVVVKVDGLPLSGTSGSGTAEFVEEEINDSRATSGGYWEIMTLTDMDVEKLSYDVIMKVAKAGGYDIIPNPIANVAANTTYSPVYVPATALLVCDMSTKVLKMRAPVEWMNLHGHSDSASYTLIIRAHQTAQ